MRSRTRDIGAGIGDEARKATTDIANVQETNVKAMPHQAMTGPGAPLRNRPPGPDRRAAEMPPRARVTSCGAQTVQCPSWSPPPPPEHSGNRYCKQPGRTNRLRG